MTPHISNPFTLLTHLYRSEELLRGPRHCVSIFALLEQHRLFQIHEETNVDGAVLAFLSLQPDSVAVVLLVHPGDGAAGVIAIDILQKDAGNEVERYGILVAIHDFLR